MTKRYEHIKDARVKPRFSRDRLYRYSLEITHCKLAKGKTACVVMQNPSYAGTRKDGADKSVQFMEKVVFEKGLREFCEVRRLIVINLFARIQTNGFKGHASDVGKYNNSVIETVLKKADIIILGWGSGKEKRFEDRKEFVRNILRSLVGKQLYKTRKHPSRGAYDGFIQPYYI